MKLYIKYDINQACKVILQEHLERLGIPYEVNGMSEIQVNENFNAELYKELKSSIIKYGIEIVDNPKNAIVQKIKEVIVEMVYTEDKLPYTKLSEYISNKMKLSYSYLSKLFAEVTYSSIESYIILQRIERVKQLIIEENLTLTEVAYKLNYSSVAHLSYQFKKTTGLTPTVFQRIIEKRNNLNLVSDTINK